MDKSEERAREILSRYLDEAKKLPFLKSIILVGSLSDGSYTANAGSDIDLAHIVCDEEDYALEKRAIHALIGKIEERTNRDIPIARVVYQQRQLVHPYGYDFALSLENKDLMQRPIEVLRIIDSGITIYGEELRGAIEPPTRADVKRSAQLEAQWLKTFEGTDFYAEYQKMQEHPTIRIMTQIVLTTAMSDYYYYTGRSCSSKYRILECVKRDCPGLSYLNLLKLVHKNRFSPEKITQDDIDAMEREYQTRFRTRRKTWHV